MLINRIIKNDYSYDLELKHKILPRKSVKIQYDVFTFAGLCRSVNGEHFEHLYIMLVGKEKCVGGKKFLGAKWRLTELLDIFSLDLP